jgi:uncharacterized protein YhdP
MSRARRIWKWTAATVAVLLVLAGAGLGLLRVWLEQSTTLAPSVIARLEKASGLHLEFSKLDARLGLYGPELVFREARLYAPGERDPLAAAGAGRVGVDWWRMLRTGRLTAGRVTLDRARLHVLVTPKGIELLHQGPLWRDERAEVSLDRLPVGHVKIDDATVVVEDTRTRAAPVRLDGVDMEIERNPSSLAVSANANLPRSLGSRFVFEGHADGNLGAPESLAWRANVTLRDAQLGGYAPFAAGATPLPTAGVGDLRVDARGRGATSVTATARFAFDGVALPPAGATRTTYRRLGGELRVEREGAKWTFAGRDLEVDPGRDPWRAGQFDVSLDLDEGALTKLVARTPDVQLAALAPLAALVPAGTARDAALALAPRGRVQALDATLTRGDGVREWRIDGAGRFSGLGTGAWHRLPGFAGLDGDFRARGTEGRLSVHTKGFDLDLPEYLAGRVSAREGSATLDWWWKPDGWRFATDDLRAIAPDGRGGGKARLWIPSDDRGPRLVLDLSMSDIDARGVPKYLPAQKLPPPVVTWLDHAFLGGRVAAARLTYAGDMRRFPFRDGGGEFRVTATYEGMKVHYQDGWDDLEDVTGEITFLNAGFDARVSKARVRGITASTGTATMADFHDATLVVRADARGDLRDGLAFVQRSPIGPRLGRYFMALAARGPLEARVALDLPFRRFADRVVALDARFDRASAKLPNVDDDVRNLTGTLRLRNRDVDVPQVTGTLLGGPFRAKAQTVDGARGERVLTVQADGRATGAKLQPLIAITQGTWLDGTFDWTASGRIPRLEWRPDPLPLPADAPEGAEPVPREPEVRWLPMTFRADATLAGLAIRLPAPLAKGADEPRSARVDFVVDPGVDDGDPEPPRLLRATREPPRPTTLIARAQSGRDAAVLGWRYDDTWAFERASVRLGGGTPTPRDARGLWIDGRVPELDLSAWLRVRLTSVPALGNAVDGSAAGLAALLKGGSVVADRFTVLGFTFPSVTMQLEGRDKAWRAQVDGPSTRGRIVVPFDLLRGDPLVLDMDRLVVGDHSTTPAAAGADGDAPTDPREMPALQITVRNLEVMKRRFGSLQANVVRTTDGLRLDRGTLQGASFEVEGKGAWTAQAGGSTTRLHVEAKSSDVLDTLNAWGFAPSISGKSGTATADFDWSGGPEGDVLARLNGTAKVAIESGQLLTVEPGAGRVLGLMSVGALPRRLTLDFTDLTDKGMAYDSITGNFDFRNGNAHTSNLLLKSPAAEIGIVGRTGLSTRDYDQTAVVTGHLGGPIAAAGAIAAGPAIGAALLLFSKVFKEPLSGMARGYYRITGSWDKPKVERIGAREADAAVVGDAGRGDGK